ncbi:uncharacterized protein AB9W97_002193 isoform 1-T8 [Spinachia spinachia]
MEKVVENILAMLEENPSGIPLKKLAVFYSQTYRKNLTLTSLGFDSMSSLVASLDSHLVVEGELVRHKNHCCLRRAGAGPSTKATEDSNNMVGALEDIVAMVKQNPAGIPLKKLSVTYSQTYKKNLTLSSLGFDSITGLVASLDKFLVVEGQMVFCKYHRRDSCSGVGTAVRASAKATEEKIEKVLENILAMIIKHPAGIPLKMVAKSYSQKYRHNLSLTSLGFKTISSLIKSLNEDLVLSGDVVFHKIHLLQNQPSPGKPRKSTEDNRPATPQRKETLIGKSCATPSCTVPEKDATAHYVSPTALCLRVNPLSTLSKPTKKLTQGVTEVKNTETNAYPNTAVSQPTPEAQDLEREPKEENLEHSIVTNFLSGSDFPVLRENVTSTKEKKDKIRDAPNFFREAYNAQLREVHGANMRAVEAIDENARELPGTRRNTVLDQDSVNSLMQDVIRDIAAQGELVTEEKVISEVCRLMQIPSLDACGIKHWKIASLKDLQYIRREINMFIESTAAVTSICTLYELGQSLAGLKDKKRYEELNLGPLCKLPLIHRMFKIDTNTKDDDIYQIETIDILKQIRMFRRQQNKPKVDLAEFMKYLADHYSCDSPYKLGIRIHSIGLPIATILKVSRCEHSIMEKAKECIQRELEEEIYERLRKIKKSVLEPVQGTGCFSSTGSRDLRREYASMSAAEVSLAVFSYAEGLFSSKMAKHVQNFFVQVSGNQLAKALFQLAICGGSLAVPPDMVLKEKASIRTEPTKIEDKPTTSLPSEAKVKQYLKESLFSPNTAITLAHMAILERKLAKHFQVRDFLSLGQGSFLEFLVKHIQLLQDTLGSTLPLCSGSMERAGSSIRPTRQDVFEFITQCGDIKSTNPDELSHIEAALRDHYRIRDSRDLGYGTLQMLAGLVQRQRGLAGAGLSQVYYESALFAKHSKISPSVNSADGGQAVGRLGEMSKAQAMASLISCPLLEDLSEWSQWELIFKQVYGSLQDFIEKNAANTGLAAIEVRPGLLLRITTHTGDKYFSDAAMTLDPVGTAGHLVSMVVADGIVNAPTALLANHMHTSLAAAVAKEDLSQTEEDVSCYSKVAKFLLACLTRIPNRTCQALIQQVFLEPFSRVLGQAKTKQVLISVAQCNQKHMNYLHRLGILLGITHWVKDYLKKLNPQPSQDCNTHTAPVEHGMSNLIDSKSCIGSALNMSKDECLEDNTVDSFASFHLNPSKQAEQGLRVEEEEDEEELNELSPLPKRKTSDVSSESEGVQDQSEMSNPASGQSTSDLQRAIVEDIRKNEFGVGVELTAAGQKLMQINQDRLGRSLDRLSTELYSKDTHFVLELIQNADDNSYPPEVAVDPALVFVVKKDSITVLNNEVGFQEKNIRAICDVGCSTKGKHKYGYIGQKGIGFKSVFKVTDCPEIHSNGFHLQFDKTCGPMGYILPNWKEDERPLDTQLKDMHQHSWTTKIFLPLRLESHQTRNLFHDVHPSLLLFLHRLRSISIYNEIEKRHVTMTRRNLSHNVLEVKHTEGIERWLVVKTTVKPKKIKEHVDSTELALAFQLNNNATKCDMVCQPQKQPVFAYLPLRSFGFRFIIQGDFDIPSSREDVDRDSSWNQWLRSEIAQLFLQAMDVFTNHPEFQGLKGLCQFLLFVPLPDEVLDFFKPVAGQIIQMLRGKAFLPTLSPDGKVVYKLPSQVAVCHDTVICDVIGVDELERHLSLSYLHPDLSPATPTSLLTHLGVRYLRGSDVTTVTTAMAKELMDGIHSDDALRQLARLLVCNFRALEHGYGEEDSILQTLGDLPIIPLADGRVVALNKEGVFFPMEETETKKTKAQAQKGPLAALYKDLNIVHPSLLSCVEPLESQQVQELLRRLGVHQLQPQELLEQHIYPSMLNNKWKLKPEAVVVSYLVFIKLHSSSSQVCSSTAVPVLTSRGLLCPADEKVHFSEEYGNINLTKKLPGCDWVMLSPCYVQTDGDVAGWRELFSSLGVRDGLIIRKERQTLTAQELASSPWSVEGTMWHPIPGDGFMLDDYPCEEFQALATAQLPGHLLLQQRTALLELLTTNWDTGHCYSQYLTALVIDGDGQSIKSTKSSFCHFLSCLEWVPAYRPLEGEERERKYLRPNSVYLTSPEVTSLLATHVYYVDIDPSEFSRTLGMRESISVETLINYLKEWCVKPQSDDQEQRLPKAELEGADFTSTVQHIHNVYNFIHMNCPQNSLRELFHHTPAVFIEYNRRDCDWCSGRFYHLKEVCWSDPTALFQRYRQLTQAPDSLVQQPIYLVPFYNPLDGMKAFFTRLLNVDLSPSMKQYVGLLELICSSSPLPTAELLQDVSVLYATLAQKCKTPLFGDQENIPQFKLNSIYCATLKGMVSDKRIFPTKDNSWVTLAHKPMIADSKEVEKIFKPHKQICLLNLPPAGKKSPPRTKSGNFGPTILGERNTVLAFNEMDRSLFLEICGIRQLSQCVKREPQTENLRPCMPMQAMVHSVVPYIQKFLYHHNELTEVYSELINNNIGERIKRLHFWQVGKLYIRYQLDVADNEDVLVEVQDVICLLKDYKELYIQKDHLSAKLDICRELVKLFCTESSHRKELMRFLSGLITTLEDHDSLMRFLAKEDVRELPSEEELWKVPPPPKAEMNLERGLLRSYSSISSPEEPTRPAYEDGEQTLVCWPPRASILNTGASRTGQPDSAVEAIMKLWPPPAGPEDRDPDRDDHANPKSRNNNNSSYEGNQPPEASRRLADHSRVAPGTTNTPLSPELRQQSERTKFDKALNGQKSLPAPTPLQSPPSAQPGETTIDQPAPNNLVAPEAMVLNTIFKGGAETQRPPLNLDFPPWNKVQHLATLEDMELTCQRPTTVVLSDDQKDLAVIGEWGEQLVNFFLCHWRDSGDPGRPINVLWCNQSGESGQPYDFKLTFGLAEGLSIVYVEVKSTIKKEKSFIHLSANELDFALKEKERYHIFRVYSAGDAHNVRLCRIQNLAQHLHTKDLALYLFV